MFTVASKRTLSHLSCGCRIFSNPALSVGRSFIWRTFSALLANPTGKSNNNNISVRPFSQIKEDMQQSSNWLDEKKKYLHMSLMERRREYQCGDHFVTLEDILTWDEYVLKRNKVYSKSEIKHADFAFDSNKNSKVCRKISIFKGDITTLEVDAIVNAANKSLLGGGGVDGAIHRAAGSFLLAENRTHGGCEVGQVKPSGGYKLPAKYVFNTVGPQGEKPDLLRQCYKNCMETLVKLNLKTIAFPCISTGIYGYPLKPAAHVAAQEVRRVLDQHDERIDRVIFCLFTDIDEDGYNEILPLYFPAS